MIKQETTQMLKNLEFATIEARNKLSAMLRIYGDESMEFEGALIGFSTIWAQKEYLTGLIGADHEAADSFAAGLQEQWDKVQALYSDNPTINEEPTV